MSCFSASLTVISFCVNSRCGVDACVCAVHAGGGRQIADSNAVTAAQHDGVFHRRAQLPHIARPRIINQGFQRLGGEILDGLAEFTGEFAQETLRQQRDVASAFAQRRQMDFHDLEAIVKVFAEFARS